MPHQAVAIEATGPSTAPWTRPQHGKIAQAVAAIGQHHGQIASRWPAGMSATSARPACQSNATGHVMPRRSASSAWLTIHGADANLRREPQRLPYCYAAPAGALLTQGA